MKRIRRILYATDFLPVSLHAFTTALRIAKSTGAQLTVVHVTGPIITTMPEQYLDGVTLGILEKQARQWCTRELGELTRRARRSGVRTKVLLLQGDPAGMIVRSARSQHADLIVLGTHGRRGLTKLFLGSVAERVVRTAPCPVVTTRGSRK